VALAKHNWFLTSVSRSESTEALRRETVRTTEAWVRSSANPSGADKCAGLPTIDASLFSLEWHRRESSSLCLAARSEPVKSGPGLLTPGLPTVLPAAKQITGRSHSSFSFVSASKEPVSPTV
jgi:hypothetical protein